MASRTVWAPYKGVQPLQCNHSNYLNGARFRYHISKDSALASHGDATDAQKLSVEGVSTTSSSVTSSSSSPSIASVEQQVTRERSDVRASDAATNALNHFSPGDRWRIASAYQDSYVQGQKDRTLSSGEVLVIADQLGIKPVTGGGGTPQPSTPQPAAPVDTRTQAEKEAAFYAAYNAAIDKAIAGDPTDMKNLDKFFTGAERPPIGYDPGYLQLERRAQAAGVSIDQQKANETALATSSTKLIRGDGPINPDDGGANTGNGAAVFAVNAKGEKFHITGNAAQDMRNKGTWTEPVVVSQSVVDGMAFGGRIEWASELANINSTPAPEPSSGTPLIPQYSEPEVNQEQEAEKARVAAAEEEEKRKDEEARAKIASEEAEEHRKDAEAHAKAAAAQAAADEKKQQALAIATANKNSAKEERIRKLNEMRRPWMGGGASSSSGADAMVAPPITPASQVPPPPFQ